MAFMERVTMKEYIELYQKMNKNDEKCQKALAEAEKFLLKKKLTGIEKYYVRFFITLAGKDEESISECLQRICEVHQRQGYPV